MEEQVNKEAGISPDHPFSTENTLPGLINSLTSRISELEIAEAPAVAITQLADVSPSGAVSVDFTSIPDTGGDLFIEGFLAPVGDGDDLWLRFNNVTSSDYKYAINAHDSGGTGNNVNSNNANRINITSTGIGNASDEGVSFSIRIPSFSRLFAGEHRNTHWISSGQKSNARLIQGAGGGLLELNVVINRITLFFSGGNIAVGRVRLYSIGL